jgi:hypothetical protein
MICSYKILRVILLVGQAVAVEEQYQRRLVRRLRIPHFQLATVLPVRELSVGVAG